MTSMISMASRRIPRTFLRTLNIYLEKNLTEVPSSNKFIYVGARNLSRCGIKSNKHNLSSKSTSICVRNDRFFRTSSALLQSETVKCPAFPESVTEGDVKLEKKVGDAVAADEVVMEIETDKTSMPVHSPNNGIIEEILVKDGDTVKAGQPLFKLKLTAGAPPPSKAAPKEAPAPPPAAAPKAPPPAPRPQAPPPPRPPPPQKHPHPHQVPPAPPRPKPGAPTPPPAAPAAPPAPPKPAAAPPARPAAPVSSIPVAAIRHAQTLETATVKMPPQDPTKEITGTRSEQRVKMNRMRLKIAQRLKEAQNTNAMLTTFNEIDMSGIMDFRKQNQDAFQKKHGLKLGFMSAFLKASAYALQDQPVVNAVIDGNEIIYRDYVDISVAVATPKGLVVPVIRNVERMNFADIERAMAALAEKAKKNAIAIEDMDGGTFTVSNGGVFGSLMGTPIINPPQSAILGMHAIFEKPVALKGQVVIRPIMIVALTYDHRLIDGREAVLFLRKIKQCVEDPRNMIAGL